MKNAARCVSCGCTDNRACLAGCSWILVSRQARIGVCSQCNTPAARHLFRTAQRVPTCPTQPKRAAVQP